MRPGDLRSKIDNVWNAFWAGGIANPLEVIEQITYLLFMRGLDEAHTREENKAIRLGKPIERRIFPKGKDGIGKNGGIAYEDMRWSRLKNQDPATMFETVSEHVFPFLRVHGTISEVTEARRARGGDCAGWRAVRLLHGA
jgi:type I restriction enzyme M protein